jgi:LPXTG-site transpeptidase (sortase) family protein
MPVNRFAPALSALSLCLGLLLIAGVRPVPPASATLIPTATNTTPIAAGYRIKIPRLAIELPIAEGDLERDTVRQETPERFAFHLPGSAIPGDPGNSYIYAHARHGMFLSLWNAREGDEILIITPDARELRYFVSKVQPRVEPGDVSWAERTVDERLTLQTSTGPAPGDPRFVVIALPL